MNMFQTMVHQVTLPRWRYAADDGPMTEADKEAINAREREAKALAAEKKRKARIATWKDLFEKHQWVMTSTQLQEELSLTRLEVASQAKLIPNLVKLGGDTSRKGRLETTWGWSHAS